jgi:glycosyltransferase involved in cell wall biosynthesis
MKIINAMFSKNLGGIEQAFLDYTECLVMTKNEVICVIQPQAKIKTKLVNLKDKFENIKIVEIANRGKWDFFAKKKISNLIKNNKPDFVICHGNRPASLFYSSCLKNKVKLIAVAHNYNLKAILKADYLFSITEDIKKIASKHFDKNKIFVIPNLTRISAEPEFKPLPKVPTIGVLARMVEKKGIDYFIQACGFLRDKGIEFNAIIGGDGDLRNNYQTLRDNLKLNDKVKFIGWVKDKNKFYNDIDIFCLPSLSEPFGIVLLEAMSKKKPIVATNIEGPAEILEDGKDAVLVEKELAIALCEGLEKILLGKVDCKNLTDTAYKKLQQKYDLNVVAQTLQNTISELNK